MIYRLVLVSKDQKLHPQIVKYRRERPQDEYELHWLRAQSNSFQPYLDILRTCKDVYLEATPVFYRENSWEFDIKKRLGLWSIIDMREMFRRLQRLGNLRQLAKIQYLRLQVQDDQVGQLKEAIAILNRGYHHLKVLTLEFICLHDTQKVHFQRMSSEFLRRGITRQLFIEVTKPWHHIPGPDEHRLTQLWQEWATQFTGMKDKGWKGGISRTCFLQVWS